MSKHAPVPLRKSARSSLAGLIHSVAAFAAANKGTIDLSDTESADRVPANLEVSLSPSEKSPFKDEIGLIAEAAKSILVKYANMDASLVLPAKEMVRGQNSLVGKGVYIAERAPRKLRDKFGAGKRQVLAEVENEETGEIDVQVEGGLTISKANVVLKRAS